MSGKDPSNGHPEWAIVEFIRARLNERESLARAATRGPWRAHPAPYFCDVHDAIDECGSSGIPWEVSSSDGAYVVDHCTNEGGGTDELNGRHIAANDPSRILRDIAADRTIVEYCWTNWIEHSSDWRSVESHDEEGAIASAQVVRMLAKRWSDHPDYRKEWSA